MKTQIKKDKKEEKKECAVCKKKRKNWFRTEGRPEYFCSLKHLNEYEIKK